MAKKRSTTADKAESVIIRDIDICKGAVLGEIKKMRADCRKLQAVFAWIDAQSAQRVAGDSLHFGKVRRKAV